jgi:hypothetical protein
LENSPYSMCRTCARNRVRITKAINMDIILFIKKINRGASCFEKLIEKEKKEDKLKEVKKKKTREDGTKGREERKYVHKEEDKYKK